jgi:hypothetical protein
VPNCDYIVWRALALLGWRIERADGPDVDWAWQDATTCSPYAAAINGRCTDITKSRVDEAMRVTFGYCAAVDPRVHHGQCLRKSESNGSHDGAVIICPAEREPGWVYQRLIDNRVPGARRDVGDAGDGADDGDGRDARGAGDPELVVDLRLLKVGPGFPLGLYKVRQRLLPKVQSVTLFDPPSLFSATELERLLAASEWLGLDVGELDVLRDADGRVYLVDAAKTAWAGTMGISGRDRRRVAQATARALAAYMAGRHEPARASDKRSEQPRRAA